MTKLLCSILVLLGLVSTTLVKAQPARVSAEDVVVLASIKRLPAEAEYLSKTKVTPNNRKQLCSYEEVIRQAKENTATAGGNVLVVTSWLEPSAHGNCYGLHGKVFRLADAKALAASERARDDSAMRSLVPDTAGGYAMLYIYRPPGGTGMLVSYNIHVYDSIICRVHDGDYYALRIYPHGPTTIWTRTEARAEVPFNVLPGKAYFLQCAVSMGAFVGHPSLAFITPAHAIHEFRFDKVKGVLPDATPDKD